MLKVELLESPMLDYWAGRAAEWHVMIVNGVCEDTLLGGKYSPSTGWAQGGPIIEREQISVEWGHGLNWYAVVGESFSGHGDPVGAVLEGPTPLIAAMRAYVASKFGDTVPDEVPT